MDVDLVRTALTVLQASVSRTHLHPQDVIALRHADISQSEHKSIEDIAREVVECYLEESKKSRAMAHC